jgi:protein-disulfide isomerase
MKALTVAAATLAGLLALAGPAQAQGGPFSVEQRKAIGDIVREYLVRNPEVLQEAFQELERRQAEAQKTAASNALRDDRDKIYNSPSGIVVGNPAGDVTLVEFFDYNCGYCKRSLGDIRQMVKSDPKLKVVLKDFPVLGPDSVAASRVALAAKQQLKGDKLFEYHARLMESRGKVDAERAMALAKEMGLDMARLAKDADAASVKDAIRENVELGDRLGLTGTPAFIIADEIVFGAVGLEPLRRNVAAVRQCGKAVC